MKFLLISFLIVFVSCSGGKNRTGFSGFTDMEMAVPYEAFSENPVYANGQTNQLPQPNTIARGFLPHPQEKVDGEWQPVVMSNPYDYSEYAKLRGERLYKMMCSHCLGAKGKADGLVVVHGGFPQPPKFSERRWKKIEKYPTGYVYNIITYGLGNMQPHAANLKPRERWYVSEYVRRSLMKGGNKIK